MSSTRENSGELSVMCRQAWGVYEYLRDNDLSRQSGTSKRLQAKDFTKLRTRLLEELAELQGVLLGTHFHEGLPQDMVLEGYEVFYWAVCLAVAGDITYETLEPGICLQQGFTEPALPSELLGTAFQELIECAGNSTKDFDLIKESLILVGKACAAGNIDPSTLLERDLAEMREKDYLADFWGKK